MYIYNDNNTTATTNTDNDTTATTNTDNNIIMIILILIILLILLLIILNMLKDIHGHGSLAPLSGRRPPRSPRRRLEMPPRVATGGPPRFILYCNMTL